MMSDATRSRIEELARLAAVHDLTPVTADVICPGCNEVMLLTLRWQGPRGSQRRYIARVICDECGRRYEDVVESGGERVVRQQRGSEADGEVSA